MPNITIENVDVGNVILSNGVFDERELTFTGAGTILSGTILAVDSVTLKLVPFVKGGATNENGIPKVVITYDVEAAGAGDEPVTVMTSGEVRKPRLIIVADGDDSNIDKAVEDQLRDYGITPKAVTDLSVPDNQ